MIRKRMHKMVNKGYLKIEKYIKKYFLKYENFLSFVNHEFN